MMIHFKWLEVLRKTKLFASVEFMRSIVWFTLSGSIGENGQRKYGKIGQTLVYDLGQIGNVFILGQFFVDVCVGMVA